MALIFKNPTLKTKGIIVFTHKEMQWFFPGKNKVRLIKSLVRNFSINKTKEILKNLIFSQKYAKYYELIRKDYFIGIHYGWDIKDVVIFNNCDFVMSAESNLPNKGEFMKVPLSSKNFNPSYFSNQNIQKFWDILCIARNVKFKNLNYFLKSIKKIYEKGYNYRVLLICPQGENENKFSSYVKIIDDYLRLFSSSEREKFTIMRITNEIGFTALPFEVISYIYNSSKIFTLFSQKEGESRVIAEALLCGLPIVVKDNLSGGGRDGLDETNSMFFKEYENAHDMLIKAVENYDTFTINSKKLREEFGEEYSIERLKKYFQKLYDQNNQKFDGDLINTDQLNWRLPGHLYEGIPWRKSRNGTSDIVSMKQLKALIDCLKLNVFQNNF